MWRTSNMGHLHRRLLLVHLLTCCVISAERACPGFPCGGGACVASSSLCDGSPDCPDGSDESQHNCGGGGCGDHQFACGGGGCVSLLSRCDGVNHCGDGSDETACRNCSSGAFHCAPSGVCLPRARLCDGRTDCPDGRDEGGALCGVLLPSSSSSVSAACAASEYRCSDGQCVPLSGRCDRSPDCPDGADERDCDQDECAVDNGGCSHQCFDLPLGFMCACPRGMRLLGDSQCEEVDPCLDSDLCDQLCVSATVCGCQAGYERGPGPGDCTATGVPARLVLSTSEDIRWVGAGGEDVGDQAMRTASPSVLAPCVATNTLYWAPHAQGSIYRASMDSTPWEPILVLRVQGLVSGLAVDWLNRLLYWSDRLKGSINVAPLDGSERRPVIRGLEQPTAVAVEPGLRLLFWAESGAFPKIMKAGLDGQNVVTLVTSSIRNPVAISLDVPRLLLYWADQDTRTVSRVDLTGQHRKTVLKSNGYMDQLSGLALFQGEVYWSDGRTRSVCRADKHNGSTFRVLLQTPTPPGGLVIIHPLLQPTGAAGPQSPPAPASADTTFTGILTLIVFLGLLLVSLMACWGWRQECRPSRNIQLQSICLKESQDPLLHSAPLTSRTSTIKDTLVKVDLETD